MPIFIAKQFNGDIESVILAKNYALANVYWQGKGVAAHSVEEINETQLQDHPTGVIPLVHTQNKQIYANNQFKDLRVISKI
jgi:hypothetical protein